MVTDAGYALPTAVVARSIANMQTPNIGPIYFVWIDDEAPPRELIGYLDKAGINLVTAQNSLLRTMKPAYAGYVTRASAARLFLATLLEKFPVDKFLCLDGDIEVAGSLGALAAIDLPHDHIAATGDYAPLLASSSQTTVMLRKRLRDLGMPENAPYFNSGVILGHMDSWHKISVEAQQVLLENIQACTYYEQCALNAVTYSRCLALSPKWNFQAPLFRLNVEADIKPGIVHFTGSHKPWGSVPLTRPWQARGPFLAARAELPQLWKRTALRNSLRTSLPLFRKALKQYSKKPKANERSFFLDYMSSTRFVDEL